MNALAKDVQGDYDLRGRDADQAFATPRLNDAALTAATWRCPRTQGFPGLALYFRIVAGNVLNDDMLFDWARGLAQGLARSHTTNWRRSRYVRGGDWVDDAGHDALWRVVTGRWPVSSSDRAEQYGIDAKTYRKVRDPVAGGMLVGLDNFVAALHARYYGVRDDDRDLMAAFRARFTTKQ